MNRFVFNCIHCNGLIEASDDLIGLELQCIYCFQNLMIPSPVPVPVQEEKITSSVLIRESTTKEKFNYLRLKKYKVIACFLVILLLVFFSWSFFFKKSYTLESVQKILRECNFVLEFPEPEDAEMNYVKCKSYWYYYPDKYKNTFIKVYVDFEGKFLGFSGGYDMTILNQPSSSEEVKEDRATYNGSYRLDRFIRDFTGLKSCPTFIDRKELPFRLTSSELSYPYDGGYGAYIENNKYYFGIINNGFLDDDKVHFTKVSKVLFILNK